MNRENVNKPELLAPAGSFEAMRASVNAGADAVYMGGKRFGARAFADNPDAEGLKEAIDFCHMRDRKLYLTVNTLLKEEELKKELYGYLLPLYEAGLDAVIVQDIGVMDFIGSYFPDLDIHVSTQCSLTMGRGAEGIRSLLKNPQSVKRIVPARELSLEELKRLRADTDLEIEVFIHGALCYCYSGQCLLSSLAGGRSGNRGRCAQPCRKSYYAEIDGSEYRGHILSTKDMCTLECLKDLIDAGVDSFKIEGRMKSPEYVAGAVAAYRAVIDDLAAPGYAKDDLSELYNRGGFSTGYLYGKNGPEMMSTERPGHFGIKVGEVSAVHGRKAGIRLVRNVGKGDVLEIRERTGNKTGIYEFTVNADMEKGDFFEILTMKDRYPSVGMEVYRTKNRQLLDRLDSEYLESDKKSPVDITLTCQAGKPLEIIFRTETGSMENVIEVCSKGNTVESAKTAGLTEENLKKQVSKLGNTAFYPENITIVTDGNSFVSVGELNWIRREAVELLTIKKTGAFRRRIDKERKCEDILRCKAGLSVNAAPFPDITAYVRNLEQLKTLCTLDKDGLLSDIYFDIDQQTASDALDICLSSGKNLFFVLPRVLRSGYNEKVEKLCRQFVKDAGFLVRNYEEIDMVEKLNAVFRTDSNIYTFNSLALERIRELFLKGPDPGDTHGLEYGYTLPYELNKNEMTAVSDKMAEMIVYGLIPVMISAQCPYKTVTGKCGEHGRIMLQDDKKYSFINDADCRYCINTIYNPLVLNLLHRIPDVKDVGCGRIRLQLSYEKEEEIRLLLSCLRDVKMGKPYVFPEELMGLKFTNGMFLRSIE